MQRGDRVQQSEDFNGDPETLKNACNDLPSSGNRKKDSKQPWPNRLGMKYREDGEYCIDNNIAERNVRPFTVDRKNTMTFGSEEGIDCAATYHTIIQTCRMMGVKVLKYLQSFFKKFSEGCRDYANMVPGKLALD